MPKTGLVVSCIIHAAVLAIPISVYNVQCQQQEQIVEILIADETPEKKSVVEDVRPLNSDSRPLAAVQPKETVQLLPEPDIIPHVKREAPLPDTLGQVIAENPVQEVRPAANTPVFKIPRVEPSAMTIPALPEHPGESGISPPDEPSEEKYSPIETVFGSAEGPDFIDRTIPNYPRQALRLNKEGTVLLLLTIDEAGRLIDMDIIEGAGYGLTEAAIAAVRNSTFRPAVRNGLPVTATAVLPIRFEIRR